MSLYLRASPSIGSVHQVLPIGWVDEENDPLLFRHASAGSIRRWCLSLSGRRVGFISNQGQSCTFRASLREMRDRAQVAKRDACVLRYPYLGRTRQLSRTCAFGQANTSAFTETTHIARPPSVDPVVCTDGCVRSLERLNARHTHVYLGIAAWPAPQRWFRRTMGS